MVVTDFTAYFTGVWRIERRIHDRRLGQRGRLIGTARFEPADDALDYVETGLLEFGDHRGEATARYRYRPLGGGAAEVLFPDGRFFHRFDLGSAPGGSRISRVRHDCAPDLYRGRYVVIGRECWLLGWRIAGPRKTLSLATRYERIGRD